MSDFKPCTACNLRSTTGRGRRRSRSIFPSGGVARQRVGPTSLGITPRACTILNKLLLLFLLAGYELRISFLSRMGAGALRGPCPARQSTNLAVGHAFQAPSSSSSSVSSSRQRAQAPPIQSRCFPQSSNLTAPPTSSLKPVPLQRDSLSQRPFACLPVPSVREEKSSNAAAGILWPPMLYDVGAPP